MQSTIQSLQGKLDEQKYLLDQLRLWADVKAQGIDPDDVAAFTLIESFIPKFEQSHRRILSRLGRRDPYVIEDRILRYNAVRLKDGTYKQLDPPVRKPGVSV